MKKVLLVLCLLLAAAYAGAEPLDFVVLLDISESMFPYFDETVEYLIQDILKEHLIPSDGFHLLSFSSYPEIELIIDIDESQNVRGALDRILLLQPFGKYTDLVSALKFVYSYTGSVRQNSSKKILVLTDGIHDPPPGSPYPVDVGDYRKTASGVIEDIRKQGWEIILIQFPRQEDTRVVDGSGQTSGDAGDPSSTGSGTGGSDAGRTTRDGGATGDAGASQDSGTPSGDAAANGADGSRSTESGQETGRTGTDSGAAPTASDGSGAGDTRTGDTGDSGARSGARSGDGTDGEQQQGVDLFGNLKEDTDVDIVDYNGTDGDVSHQVTRAPELVFPEDLGRVGYKFVLPLTVRNPGEDPILLILDELVWNGIDILDREVRITVRGTSKAKMRARVVLPASTEPGDIVMDITAGFADDFRTFPRSGTTKIYLRAARTREGTRSLDVLPILGYTGAILGGLIVLVLIVLAVRNLVARTFHAAGSSPVVRGAVPGDRAIEMYVEGQNSNIGSRNIHAIRDGGTRTIGGGLSAYLIYMYQFPMRIAEITRSGRTYTFTPLKAEFCRDSAKVSDCIDKDIRLISANKREVRIRFRRYVSALEKINSIMRLVDQPGRPSGSDDES